MIKKSQPSLSSQKGISTILIVMLVGIVLSIIILGTAYYIRGKQHAQVANHAVTNAQSGAWIGVELLRKYFEGLNKTQIDSLQAGSAAIGLSGITASIDTITPPTNSTDPYQIIVTIKNISSISQAASSIRVLYNVVPSTSSSSGGGGGTGTTSVMDIYSDLDLSGGITFSQNGTKGASINVYGNFSTGGVGLTGIDTLSTTGNVTLTSSAHINNIYTNGNVNLTGSASADLISAKGYIDITGGGTQGNLNSDGYINLGGGVNVNNANTLSYIDWSSGGTGQTFTAGNYVNHSNGTVNNILAKGNVTLSGGNPATKYVTSEKLLTCPNNWSSYTLLKAVSFSNRCPQTNVQTLPEGTNSIVATGALVTVTAPNKPLVNALSYESQANYIIDVDTNKDIVVTVQNVDGIPKGTYYIAKYTLNYNDYIGKLCSGINQQGFCTGTSVGYIYPPNTGSWNSVISYSGGSWSLKDNNGQNPSLAPGVFLFKGDLKPQQGNYANTLLSTGSIDYGTSIILKAPNYAGANVVCNSPGFGRPTNLCSSSTALIPAAIGNIALLAGSCTNATTVALCKSTYSGGDISLGAQSTVYGNVIAGNLLNTSGQALIVGSLSAAGLGDTKKGSKFTGSTTIDLTSLKDHPDFSIGDSSNSGSTSTGSGTTTATVKWARYL